MPAIELLKNKKEPSVGSASADRNAHNSLRTFLAVGDALKTLML